MRIDNVPELRSKINQLPATFIQDKKKKNAGQRVMLYVHGEFFGKESIKNPRIAEIIFTCSRN